MNPQTQNRLAALAIGAGTIAYLGIKKPWKKTESMIGPVPESKLPSPDLKGIKQEMQQNEKALGTAPVMQEKGTDLAGNATKDTPKRN